MAYLATTTGLDVSLAILVFNGRRLSFKTDKYIFIYARHTDNTETTVTTISDILYYVMT